MGRSFITHGPHLRAPPSAWQALPCAVKSASGSVRCQGDLAGGKGGYWRSGIVTAGGTAGRAVVAWIQKKTCAAQRCPPADGHKGLCLSRGQEPRLTAMPWRLRPSRFADSRSRILCAIRRAQAQGSSLFVFFRGVESSHSGRGFDHGLEGLEVGGGGNDPPPPGERAHAARMTRMHRERNGAEGEPVIVLAFHAWQPLI